MSDLLRVKLTLDRRLPSAFDAWVAVLTHGDGSRECHSATRPDLAPDEFAAARNWVGKRLDRLLWPDGSEPDVWRGPPNARFAWLPRERGLG